MGGAGSAARLVFGPGHRDGPRAIRREGGFQFNALKPRQQLLQQPASFFAEVGQPAGPDLDSFSGRSLRPDRAVGSAPGLSAIGADPINENFHFCKHLDLCRLVLYVGSQRPRWARGRAASCGVRKGRLHMSRVLALVFLALSPAGCAPFTVTRVQTPADHTEGIRFYRPRPYLLVTATDKGPAVTVVSLPDPNEEYVIRLRQGLGASQFTAKLADGWNLIEIGHSTDSAFPQTLTAAGALAAVTGAFGMKGPTEGLTPGLYEIVFANKRITGLRKIHVIP